ncbi:MAG: OsmC family peroxiredoxin [Nitrospirae bacterium]|nr:MAG: OsmC family peroxiredoxin [Nitrospirota bacterium]
MAPRHGAHVASDQSRRESALPRAASGGPDGSGKGRYPGVPPAERLSITERRAEGPADRRGSGGVPQFLLAVPRAAAPAPAPAVRVVQGGGPDAGLRLLHRPPHDHGQGERRHRGIPEEPGAVIMQIAYKGGARFDVTSGRHTIVTDQPVGDGGSDAGMSPVELFVGSLGGCVAYFVGRYCARHQIPCAGFTVDVEWSSAEQPHRVGAVAIKLNLPADLSPEQGEKLLKVAHGCTVHQSLIVPPKVEVRMGSRDSKNAAA